MAKHLLAVVIVSFLMFFLPYITVLAQQQQQLLQQEQQRPWIGIAGIDMTPKIAVAMGANQTKGSLVAQVTYGSPAQRAGIRGGYITADVDGAQIPLGGDIILRIDNTTINTINDVNSYLNTKNVGDTVQVTVARDNAIKNIALTLAAMPGLVSEPPKPQLQLLGMNTFYDNNQFNTGLHIVGEVLNNGTQTATSLSVFVTLYDISNQVVGTGHTDLTPSSIEPGKKVPFEIIVYRDNIKGGDFNNIYHVNVQVG